MLIVAHDDRVTLNYNDRSSTKTFNMAQITIDISDGIILAPYPYKPTQLQITFLDH